jgi:uncharacterized protein with HEPN domain
MLIENFVKGKDLGDYVADPMMCSAVERQFEIIGEALNQALRLDPKVTQKISRTGRIITFHNRLIHGYASISDEVVWGVIEANLSVLHREVDAMLKRAKLK